MTTVRIASTTGPVDPYIEEPALFNQHVAEFLTAVENGRWGTWKRGSR
jgi:hypothetical protein